MNIESKVLIAKALRKSFHATQSDLLKQSFWDDDKLVEMVRNMQDEYKAFDKMVDEIKAEDRATYEREILGMQLSSTDEL